MSSQGQKMDKTVSLRSTLDLLWIKMTLWPWPQWFTISFTVPCNKTITVRVLTTVYLYSATQGGSKEKKDSWNPQYIAFSVAPQMTLLSLPDSKVMKVNQQVDLKELTFKIILPPLPDQLGEWTGRDREQKFPLSSFVSLEDAVWMQYFF